MIKNHMEMEEEEGQKEEISEADLNLVKDIIKTIVKTVKTLNVYPKDNPIFQKFAADLFDKFNAFLENRDELALDVEQNSLLFKENEIFHSEERNENIALLLFADGIRQIVFHKGITFDELADFVDILRLAPRAGINDEDDIVTLLWERNIQNMGYSAVEDTVEDDFAVEEGLLQDGNEETAAGESSIGNSSFQWRPSAASTELKAEPLTPRETQAIEDEISAIEEKHLLSSAVELFFELLSHETDMDAFPDVVQNLGKIMNLRMQKKDIEGCIEILKALKKLSSVYESQYQNELIGAVIDKAGSIDNLRILFKESSNNENIKQYLFLLEKDFIPNMVEILGELQDRKMRRLLCDVLAELGKQNVDAFSEPLKDDRWYLIRNIALILGMTKEPLAVKHLEKIMRHPDIRVRRETLRALEGIGSDDTKKLFVAALKDSDLTVRIIALKALRRFRDPGIFDSLRENMSKEDLRKKTFQEKKEMMETLAALGGEKAFSIVSSLFKKHGLIEKEDITEIRASAAFGLGIIGTPDAIALLEKESGSRKNLLRESCIKALKESQQLGNIRR